VRSERPILAVTGLAAEARIASGSGVVAVAGGGDPARLALLVQAAMARGIRAVISFGIAGGLRPGLRAGSVVIARAVDDGETRLEAAPAWVERLARTLPHAHIADLAGVDAAVCGTADKADLRRRTGADAVDMESHVAARLAALHGLPFAALRVVADPAERALPPAALAGMRHDGSTDVGAVLRSLGRRPGQLPGLIRTALDARAAFRGLASSRRDLCSLFGLTDLRQDATPDGMFGLPLGIGGGFAPSLGANDEAELRAGRP
jgi:adenosylhomocysteine nucleosidase